MFVWVVSKGEREEGGSVEAVYTNLAEAKAYAETMGVRQPWKVFEANMYHAWVNRVDYYLIERMQVRGNRP